MILQKLVEYYERKSADPDSDIAPEGFEFKEIPFIIVLDEEGNFVDITDTRESQGKKKKGKIFKVPQVVKRTRKVMANYLWDNVEYIYGNKKNVFLEKLKTLHPQLQSNVEIIAVIKFLESESLKKLQEHALWSEILESGSNLTFQILGCHHLVCQNKEVIKAINDSLLEKSHLKICLVSGEEDSIANTHHSIKGVQGAQSGGANIVSFNFDGAESFEKEQGDNAQIGTYSCFAYTTALNYLLKSTQKINFGEISTIVFWAEKNNSFENLLSDLLDSPPKDDPDRMTRAINSLYESPYKGGLSFFEDHTEFYVLGISPNAARLAIRLWHKTTVSQLATNIKRHFDDLHIIEDNSKFKSFTLYNLLRGLALREDIKSLSPNLAGAFLKCIFEGINYPPNLLSLALGRLKDEEGISFRRAAIIKAWLNRFTRKFQKNEKEIQVSLDISNNNIGYLLGRLFAVLEKTQEDALGNINSSIRDRYYSAASATPITVFPTLLKLKNHHLGKIENKGRVVNLEKIIGEIIEKVTTFPNHLTLQDQGRFAIGYYHQRQSFFSKNES